MFNTLSPAQNKLMPLQSAHKHTGQQAVVRFGGISQDRLNSYQANVQKLDEISKYNPPSFNDSFKILAPEGVTALEKTLKGLAPTEAASIIKHKLWEPIEEASDMFFELYTLHALRKNIINKDLVASWRKKYLPPDNQRKSVPFKKFMDDIASDIPPESIKAFQKTVAWDDEKKSRQMLTLIAAKFVLMHNRNPQMDLWKESKPLLMAEAKEFSDTFPWYSPRKLQIKALAFAYTHFPSLPMEWFRSQVQSILSNQLNTTLLYQDLMRCIYKKQMRRQDVDYRNPQFKTNFERKRYVKQLEICDVCSIWKKARLMNSPFISRVSLLN